MTLKIIGAGFGRTGTTSLQAALQHLGFQKCYHMTELLKRPTHAKLWNQTWDNVTAGKEPEWSKIFADYQATVDWPACAYYQELMEAYPDAKVLLSVRDPERWYESVRDTIYPLSSSWFMYLVAFLIPSTRQMYEFIHKLVWTGTFNKQFEDQAYAISIFNEHIAAVKAHVPPEKLLVYNVKEGWEPLCRFLEVDAPSDLPFPHLNDKAQIQRAMRWGPVVIILGIIIIVMSLWALFQNML